MLLKAYVPTIHHLGTLGWPVRVTAADVGGCGTYDASVDGSVYVEVDKTTPASALRRQNG